VGIDRIIEIGAEMAVLAMTMFLAAFFCFRVALLPKATETTIKPQAHSDLVYNTLNDYGNTFDIMIEAKHKELALLRYRENELSQVAK